MATEEEAPDYSMLFSPDSLMTAKSLDDQDSISYLKSEFLIPTVDDLQRENFSTRKVIPIFKAMEIRRSSHYFQIYLLVRRILPHASTCLETLLGCSPGEQGI
jgi:hypothetical protein